MTLLMLMPIYVQDERGIALLLTLMATVLLTALGGALITLTTAETAIASNYRNAVEAFYAAEAGVEYVVQELGDDAQLEPCFDRCRPLELCGQRPETHTA